MKNFINEAKTVQLKLIDSIYRQVEDKKQFSSDEEKFKLFLLEIMPHLNLGYKSLPKGSSRMVFDLGSDLVLKVALNEAGFAQNGMEATIGMDDSVADIVAPVMDTSDVVDYNGFLWISSKKVVPLNDEMVGKSWPEFSAMLKKAVTTNEKIVGASGAAPGAHGASQTDSQKTKVEIPKKAAEKIQAKNEKTKQSAEAQKLLKSVDENFFESFRNFTRKYKGAATADLLKPDSWGMDGGKLKLIDYGYTKRISQDFYVGGYSGGSVKAKESLIARSQERIKNISSTIADNIDTIENTKKIPPMSSLLLLIRGVVAGLPLSIETFAIGNPLKPMTATELAAAAEAIRTNQGKVERIIDQVTDPQLKNKLYDELDDILLSTGSLNKARQVESLIKMFISEYMLRG